MWGYTHRRGARKTRGRKRCWYRANVLTDNNVCKDKLTKQSGKYFQYEKIVKASRAPQVHRITAQRSFKREGLPWLFRHCRERPELEPEHEQGVRHFDVIHKKPVEHAVEDEVDMVLHCKMFQTQPHRKVESTCAAKGRLAIFIQLGKMNEPH